MEFTHYTPEMTRGQLQQLCPATICEIRAALQRVSASKRVFGCVPPDLSQVLPQQLIDDRQPLRLERFAADRFPSTAVPVRCIALIAFLSVEVGMNPRSRRIFDLLSAFMGTRPVAFGIPPEARERQGQVGRRICGVERVAKIIYGHCSIPVLKLNGYRRMCRGGSTACFDDILV